MHLSLAANPRVEPPGAPAQALTHQDAALLAWLAIEGPTPRSRLAQLLWPEKDAELARNSLRQRLFRLRRQFGAEVVAGSTTLTLAAGVTHDLAGAAGVLGTAPADDIAAGEFAQWLQAQRERCRARVWRARVDSAEAAEQAQAWGDAIAHARELLALDPLSEASHRRLMRLHWLAGDRAAALLAFDHCEQQLRDEVGTPPGAETLALLQTISAPAPTPLPTRSAVPAAVLRPPRLIGRQRELQALSQAWQGGQVAALMGEAGLGKTRLLQELAEHDPGFAHVSARPGDSSVPLATLARLLRGVTALGAPGALPAGTEQALPGLGSGVVGLPAPAVPAAALPQAVARCLASRPALHTLVIDDLHFADDASIDLIATLMDGPATGGEGDAPGAPPLRWIVALRQAEATRAARALADRLIEQARWAPVQLAPLGEAALAELVDSLGLPGAQGAVVAPALLRRTGGNPLFVLETLKQAWVEGSIERLPTELPRPLSVMQQIERRLTQLSPGALALARCAAIAGQAFTPALAARVLGVHMLALADAWAELERAQIMCDQAFAHDLYHEAALASVPAAIARQLHAEVARQLESTEPPGAAPAVLAQHWIAAQQPARALPHLEAAAHAAGLALDRLLQARLLGELAQARQATGDADAAFTAAQNAVEALAPVDTGATLEAAIGRMAALARTGEQRAGVQIQLASMHLMRRGYDAASDAIETGLAELGPGGSAQPRINLLNLRGNTLRRLGRMQEARESLEAALALVRATPEAHEADLAPVLNNLALVLQTMDEHLAASGLLQEAAGVQRDPIVRARVLNNLGISLEESGQAALAYEQRLAAARLCAGAKSEGLADLMLAISLGHNARVLARFGEALQHLQRAERIGALMPNWRAHDMLGEYAVLWLELGRFNQARQALEAAQACSDGADALGLALVRARLQIAQGEDPRALIEAAEQAPRQQQEWRMLRRLLLIKARVLPPAEAVEQLEALLQTRALQVNAAAALACRVRLAQALLALGGPTQVAQAGRHAQRAADALDAAWPADLSCAEVWLTLAQALRAAGDTAGAAAAAARGARWVRQVAAEHLDEPLRDGYLQRNPVNRDLLALDARLRAR